MAYNQELSVRGEHHSAPSSVNVDRVPKFCLSFFASAWLLLAIAPWNRGAWLLENLPTVAGLAFLVATFKRFRFSDRAYLQITLFLLLHTLGSHYTYSATPIGDWVRDVFQLGRNHYDRVVHFAFGALLLLPNRELIFRPPARAPWARQLVVSVAMIAAWSAGYEILEWWTARLADPSAGTAFLGTQGDDWDAQKDMCCAVTGAVLAAMLEAWVGMHRQRTEHRVQRVIARVPTGRPSAVSLDTRARKGCR